MQLGDLTCSLGKYSTTDAATTSRARTMLCSFRLSGSGLEEIYTGTLHTMGEDEQVTSKGILTWVVRAAPTTMQRPGILGQTYAARSMGADEASPPLFGEGTSSLSLRPMRNQDLERRGPMVVLGVDLELKIATG